MKLTINNGGLDFLPNCQKSKSMCEVYGVKALSLHHIGLILKRGINITLLGTPDKENLLLKWRQARGFTQADAAKQLGVAPVTYGGWERENNAPDRVVNLITGNTDEFIL